MAVTIGNFTAINDAEVDAESPITESLMTRLRDNAYWVNAGTTKTSEGTANKFLETDGSNGVQWTNTSTLGVNGTFGSGAVGTSSGSPTQVAEVTDRILYLEVGVGGASANDNSQFTIFIKQSDSTYELIEHEADASTFGTFVGSGTLTSSFVDVGGASQSFYLRVTGGNIEFYEGNTGSAGYLYLWL